MKTATFIKWKNFWSTNCHNQGKSIHYLCSGEKVQSKDGKISAQTTVNSYYILIMFSPVSECILDSFTLERRSISEKKNGFDQRCTNIRLLKKNSDKKTYWSYEAFFQLLHWKTVLRSWLIFDRIQSIFRIKYKGEELGHKSTGIY